MLAWRKAICVPASRSENCMVLFMQEQVHCLTKSVSPVRLFELRVHPPPLWPIHSLAFFMSQLPLLQQLARYFRCQLFQTRQTAGAREGIKIQ